MYKILDRYIIKSFISAVFYGLLSFTAIVVIIDLKEKLDTFIDNNLSLLMVLNYYLVFTPEIIKLMTPVAVLFAGLFTAGKMANNNELTAIKASGVSIYRFMLPFFLICTLISVVLFWFGGFVVPEANVKRIDFEAQQLKKDPASVISNLYFQEPPDKIVSINYFNNEKLEAYKVGVQYFDTANSIRMTKRIDAERMEYSPKNKTWTAYQGNLRVFGKLSDKLTHFVQMKLEDLKFVPDDLQIRQQKLEILTNDQLKKLIEDTRNAGYDTQRAEIEYYSRFSFPVTAIIIIIFGLPISAVKRRTGLALQFGVNILITFIYLSIMQIVTALGKNGSLDPLLTAWLVNIIFFSVALFNITRVRG
ncbi:MAG: LPS export ABC transporter permease LptG [Ignavibacteriales bacterium UTCHB3]|nr:MAG: LPS export ABC transporter permease LptG [Ignavibacteriales bacterium UTCHB3]